MSEKRKDHKGRILRAGEGQRPNKTYFYRYRANDKNGTMFMHRRWRESEKKKKKSSAICLTVSTTPVVKLRLQSW